MPTDPRLTPARRDIAADHLRGEVESDRFVSGVLHQALTGSVPLRSAPHGAAGLLTELLFGEVFVVYDDTDGWAWGQADFDGYVGYAPSAMLRPSVFSADHKVTALRTFLFEKPDIKSPPIDAIPLNGKVRVTETEGRFSRIEGDAWIHGSHLAPVTSVVEDHVSIVERMIGVPYLWGGRTSLGIDCSGLVQLALESAGTDAPRDTDMQETALGTAIDESSVRRGDLVFWQGHVGIMYDDRQIIHANAGTMNIAIEQLDELSKRLEKEETGAVTSVRRL